jgi:NTE family protein
VVFGRAGSPSAPLAAAVLASCSIPAYFAPVAIGGVEYFDGGVHSPTSADVLRARRSAVVVVISPMSAASFPSRRPDALIRWSAHRRLEREARRLEAGGSIVVRVEPGPLCIDAMGLRPMDEGRAARVAASAHRETIQRLAEGHFAHLPVAAPRACALD